MLNNKANTVIEMTTKKVNLTHIFVHEKFAFAKTIKDITLKLQK